MRINWKVRIKNIYFIAGIFASVFASVLTYLGMNWEEVTTWAKLWEVLLSAIQNPVIVVSSIGIVVNAVIDYTTKGLGDSQNAMTYEKPN